MHGYWHIYMKNHWYGIVHNQLRIMLQSGLYDAVEKINLSIGNASDEELQVLQKHFIELYPKLVFRVAHYKGDEQFEFPAIEAIYKDSLKHTFKGFYIHTKGATKPNWKADHWREAMNEYVINRWREHVAALDTHDLSGINYLKDWTHPHFSGNFFWFNSTYARKWEDIKTLNWANRYAAEAIVCSQSPKVNNLAWITTNDQAAPFKI